MSGKQQAKAVRRGGPIRITLAASVAQNLDALRESITTLATRVGHPNCFSGVDCQFVSEREFVIEAKGIVNPVRDPEPSPWRALTSQGANNTVLVKVAPEAAGNIETVKSIVAQVAGLVGCPGCHSGFDIYYAQEVEVLSAGAQGNVSAV
jgi:hypothetical protein